MKIFISWSGETSKNVAETLKLWLPFFFESAEVFFSPEDIEKGQNWNKRLTEELSNSNYGIVCLTTENKDAPWINFEAGAIAKAFESRVTALLVDINPSDIQGPLSMFQATKINKNDIHQLINSVNSNLEHPRNNATLDNLFEALWYKMEEDFNRIVANINVKPKAKAKVEQNEVLESILQIVREQSRILSNPENILPKEYLSTLTRNGDIDRTDKHDLREYTISILESIDRIIRENASIPSDVIYNMERIVRYTKTMVRNQQIDENDINRMINRVLNKLNYIQHSSNDSIDL